MAIIKPANQKEYRRDRRLARAAGARSSLSFASAAATQPLPCSYKPLHSFCGYIAKGTKAHADESGAWDSLHERFEVKRINHQEAY
jgi:hypothetical protein